MCHLSDFLSQGQPYVHSLLGHSQTCGMILLPAALSTGSGSPEVRGPDSFAVFLSSFGRVLLGKAAPGQDVSSQNCCLPQCSSALLFFHKKAAKVPMAA